METVPTVSIHLPLAPIGQISPILALSTCRPSRLHSAFPQRPLGQRTPHPAYAASRVHVQVSCIGGVDTLVPPATLPTYTQLTTLTPPLSDPCSTTSTACLRRADTSVASCTGDPSVCASLVLCSLSTKSPSLPHTKSCSNASLGLGQPECRGHVQRGGSYPAGTVWRGS